MSTSVSSANVPNDAGEWGPLLGRLLSRLGDPTRQYLDCGPGWYELLGTLESQLSARAPGTTFITIEEQDGWLVLETQHEEPGTGSCVDAAVARAAHTCELTGRPGVPMVNGPARRVLDPGTAPAGWKVSPEIHGSDPYDTVTVLLGAVNALRSKLT